MKTGIGWRLVIKGCMRAKNKRGKILEMKSQLEMGLHLSHPAVAPI